MIKTYKELIVWQKAMLFVKEVYLVTKEFPNTEKFGLSSQLQRAAISIPANIAEGYNRQHIKEYMQFLSIARGSLAEAETYLVLAQDLNFLESNRAISIQSLSTELSKMLFSMLKKLKNKI